ncbi:MAG: DNA polymerase IV [Thioalkalivibrio sp.]
MDELWERAIVLVDMNAFFASIEQLDHPPLRGLPVGITNGATGTCIITSSYEARVHGVRTGMRLKEARQLCPDILQIPARPERYAQVSTAIMSSLEDVTPDLEVFSVDEAFLDVTHCQRLLGSPQSIAERVKRTVWEASGLPCSVGMSGDKTTAKWAAKQHKPDGLTVVPPWEAARRLAPVPVTDLCGIAGGIGAYLAERGVYTCGDMAQLPVSELARRFGNLGRRIWLMAQALDPAPVETRIAPPKSMGHGKVMPPGTKARSEILTYLEHMGFKLGTRLRRHDMVAQRFFIGLRARHGWIGGTYRSATPTSDSRLLHGLCRRMLSEHWSGEGVCQVQITALDPRSVAGQLELFGDGGAPAVADESRVRAAHGVMDAINRRYGEFTLAPARLLSRSEMPNVIAPAWKPHGHRQTI